MTEKLGNLKVSIESGSVMSRIQADGKKGKGQTMKVLVPKALNGEINEELLDEIDVDNGLYAAGRVKTTLENDVVMKLTTPYDVGFVGEEYSSIVVSSHCAIIRVKDSESVDGRFLAYFLSSPYAKDYLRSITSGAATAMLKIKDIAGIPVPLLPIEEQRQLGEIFTAFSRKKQILAQMISAENQAEDSLIMDAVEGRM